MVALPLMSDNKDERVVLNQPDTSCHSFLCLLLQPLNNYMLLTEQLRPQTYVQVGIWQRASSGISIGMFLFWQNFASLALFPNFSQNKEIPKFCAIPVVIHPMIGKSNYGCKWMEKQDKGSARFFFLVCTL